MSKPAGSLWFEFENQNYAIEFVYEKRTVHVRDPFRKDVKHRLQSKYPYITARIVLLDENGNRKTTLYATSQGCNPNDQYLPKIGRLLALRKLTSKVNKKFRRAVWECYGNRFPKVEKKPKEKVLDEQQTTGAETV
jgi:hypothetical protein